MSNKEFEDAIANISNSFGAARDKIGATSVAFKLIPSELRELSGRFNEGKPITGVELQKISATWQSKEPLIDEEGNAFVLYIPDWQFKFAKHESQPADLHKYHVSWCKTLEYMRGAGRLKRYIKKTDIENNIFKGRKADDIEVESVLYACKNCRDKMSEMWGYSLYYDVTSMDMLKFFSLYGKQDLSDPKTNRPYSVAYPKHWSTVSKMYREMAQWKCEECHKSFADQKHLLDVHHINGIRSDVSKANLRVLCKEHHSEQPLHSHYKNVLQSTSKIEKLDLPSKLAISTRLISNSQRNKLNSFIVHPERYATSSDKARKKVLDVVQTYESMKGGLSPKEENDLLRAIEIYKEVRKRKIKHRLDQ